MIDLIDATEKTGNDVKLSRLSRIQSNRPIAKTDTFVPVGATSTHGFDHGVCVRRRDLLSFWNDRNIGTIPKLFGVSKESTSIHVRTDDPAVRKSLGVARIRRDVIPLKDAPLASQCRRETGDDRLRERRDGSWVDEVGISSEEPEDRLVETLLGYHTPFGSGRILGEIIRNFTELELKVPPVIRDDGDFDLDGFPLSIVCHSKTPVDLRKCPPSFVHDLSMFVTTDPVKTLRKRFGLVHDPDAPGTEAVRTKQSRTVRVSSNGTCKESVAKDTGRKEQEEESTRKHDM
jgi:hypothetical protein